MSKQLRIIVVIFAVIGTVAVVIFFAQSTQDDFDSVPTITSTPTVTREPDDDNSIENVTQNEPSGFDPETFTELRSPHFVSSSPDNNEILTSAPNEIVLRFDFDLALGSDISVSKDGSGVTNGPTNITDDNVTLEVPVAITQSGNYFVQYTACWPDGSCHDGSFGFTVLLDS